MNNKLNEKIYDFLLCKKFNQMKLSLILGMKEFAKRGQEKILIKSLNHLNWVFEINICPTFVECIDETSINKDRRKKEKLQLQLLHLWKSVSYLVKA